MKRAFIITLLSSLCLSAPALARDPKMASGELAMNNPVNSGVVTRQVEDAEIADGDYSPPDATENLFLLLGASSACLTLLATMHWSTIANARVSG